MPTRTINKIHFEDLSFARFEDMCVQVVYRMRNWTSIHHFGRKGKERGVDIYTEITEDGINETWFIQCKRYKELTFAQLKAIVDDVVKNNKTLPDQYIVIASCDISRDIFEQFQEYSKSKGLKKVDIITASILETMLYSKHPDLLYTFFDISVLNQRSATVARIKRRLAMKRKIEKEFADMRKGGNVIIRDVHSDMYPEQDFNNPGIYPWFKLEFCRLYHKGVSFYTSIVEVFVNRNGEWRLAGFKETVPKDWVQINAFEIGNIPYDNIVDCDFDGDEYYPFPHLYCEFNNLGQPYEEIWYSPTDQYKEVIDFLHKEKRLSSP